jgi:hypothetical protein
MNSEDIQTRLFKLTKSINETHELAEQYNELVQQVKTNVVQIQSGLSAFKTFLEGNPDKTMQNTLVKINESLQSLQTIA